MYGNCFTENALLVTEQFTPKSRFPFCQDTLCSVNGMLKDFGQFLMKKPKGLGFKDGLLNFSLDIHVFAEILDLNTNAAF